MSPRKVNKVLNSKDAKKLKAMEIALNTHIAKAQLAVKNLTQTTKNRNKLMVRHYGAHCTAVPHK